MTEVNAGMNLGGSVVRCLTAEEICAHQRLIEGVAHRFGWHEGDIRVEELVQEVLLKCCLGSHVKFDASRGTLEAFLAKIAENVARDVLRKERRRSAKVENCDDLSDWADDRVASPDFAVEQKERRRRLERLLWKLKRGETSERNYAAFEMFKLEGVRAKEVAHRLGMKESDVNRATARCLQRLIRLGSEEMRCAS